MKKWILGLLAGFYLIGVVAILAMAGGVPYPMPTTKFVDIKSNATGTVAIFARRKIGFIINVYKLTTGATDSVALTIQSAPTDRDSMYWKTVAAVGTAAGAGLADTANFLSYMYNGYNTADSTRNLGRYIRLVIQHSRDTPAAADTSTYYISNTEFGDDLER